MKLLGIRIGLVGSLYLPVPLGRPVPTLLEPMIILNYE